MNRRTLIAGLLAFTLAGGAIEARAVPPFAFGFGVKYATPSSPSCVVAGDVNGDGINDLVVTSAGANRVSVFLGRGDGSFGPRTDFAVGAAPLSVAIADLDGDGDADLVVANSGASTVSVLRGHGDGTFDAHVDFPAGPGARSVTVGDLDGDGRPDLVVADPDSDRISVLMATAGGAFATPQPFATGAMPWFVALGDLDHDGNLDAVVSNHAGGSVSAMLGRGDGTFAPRTDYTTAWDQWQVALADFNRDGHLDFVVIGATNCDGVTETGQGDGTFIARPNFDPGCSSYALAVADLNNDRIPDVLATYDYAVVFNTFYFGGFTLNPGLGTGTFGARTDWTSSMVTPVSATAADLDGNFSPDVAIVDRASSTVTVFLNQVPWGAPTTTSLRSSGNPIVTGERVSFTAVVQPDSATGAVEFRSGGVLLGRAVLRHGVAVLTLDSLSAGTHAVTATHPANADYAASRSDTLVQHVDPAPPPVLAAPGAAEEPARATSPVAHGDVAVAFSAPADRKTRVGLYDASGRRLATRTVDAVGGRVRVPLARAEELPPGLYLVRVELPRPIVLRVAVIR